MEPFIVYRAPLLARFTDVLYAMDAPVESELRRAKLPATFADRPDAYLPWHPTIRFLLRMERRVGIDELSLRAGQAMRIGHFDPVYLMTLLQSPTLGAASDGFCELGRHEIPHASFWKIIEQRRVRLCSVVPGTFGVEGAHFCEWLRVMMLITIVRQFAGPLWRPATVALTSRRPPDPGIHQRLPGTRVLLGQPTCWLDIPRAMPGVPVRARALARDSIPTPTSISRAAAGPAPDFPTCLEQTLKAYLGEGYPPVELAAQITGTSVRTLQRRLTESASSYTELVQRARFEVASTLLRDPGTRMIDVSHALGFGDPSHFARAFRRIAGVGPREYRRAPVSRATRRAECSSA